MMLCRRVASSVCAQQARGAGRLVHTAQASYGADGSRFGAGWTTEEQRAMADGQGVFGAFADAYDALRPDYPEAMYTKIIHRVLANNTNNNTSDSGAWVKAMDIGAGTGRGAVRLAQHPLVKHVTVTEPDQGMLSQCEAAFERVQNNSSSSSSSSSSSDSAEMAEATFLRVSAENLREVPEASIDVAVCLQAWHWVDNTKGLDEVARVLRPGGVFAVAWNDRDLSVPWVADLERLIESYNLDYDRDERQCDKYGRPLSADPRLRLLSQEDIPHALHMASPQQLVDLTHTFSYVRNALTAEKLEEFSKECLAIATNAMELQQKDVSNTEFELPLKTRLYLLERV
ncbi:methyltransferase type 11 [Salpingoeca rosetta]|uniref:Methyltransferase type 11 n=1 Tax=Salpingoeca rosetta (strain ATCC 50818 / BSB-021) TaxID=946362 RepID=F2UJB8_SALR5|nr:methyltransferase type 11 [Salpingoeca rosetta]EGD77217.1 methyltransferase type 11 [Salpingoeca rosetta]|eukprot:XP_004990561.1 methyltransferase type 11 [Salpingoeca rosetta]